jgi:hypothetical protein
LRSSLERVPIPKKNLGGGEMLKKHVMGVEKIRGSEIVGFLENLGRSIGPLYPWSEGWGVRMHHQ